MTAIGTSKPCRAGACECRAGACDCCAYSGELCSCPHHRTLAASPSGRSAGDLDGDTGGVRESSAPGKSSAAPGVSTLRRCAWPKCQAGGDILDGAPYKGYDRLVAGPSIPVYFHPGCYAAGRRAA